MFLQHADPPPRERWKLLNMQQRRRGSINKMLRKIGTDMQGRLKATAELVTIGSIEEVISGAAQDAHVTLTACLPFKQITQKQFFWTCQSRKSTVLITLAMSLFHSKV